MSRPALILAALFLLAARFVVARGGNPHVEPDRVPGGCRACHEGHGLPRSQMLGDSSSKTCLACHESRSDRDRQIARGLVNAGSSPILLGEATGAIFVHPIDRTALAADGRTVVCTSCHSPHRGLTDLRDADEPAGRRYLSPTDPRQFESDLCEGCHGNRGSTTESRLDLSRLLDPQNRSYHPVHAAAEPSPSVLPRLAGKEINCTDCHGNDDAAGARGPHASRIHHILKRQYVTVDGTSDPSSAFALCWICHEPKTVLEGTAFPGHADHVGRIGASCATCHNPHGSPKNRALIRIGEETTGSSVSPSSSTGRLEFVSDGPGSGECWLLCHGVDHAPKIYGRDGLPARRLRPPLRRSPASSLRPLPATPEKDR
jgi:predicted CXXCH cytochrome family protein